MITRFAPSPTGPLHLGHALSAICAHDMARAAGGRFLLRIEDIDRQRSKREWEEAILHDLAWLGLTWDAPPMRQSDRMAAYDAALGDLWDRDLLYPCVCSRRDIVEALGAPQEGVEPVHGPDGPIYPGTCHPVSWAARGSRDGHHLRLSVRNVLRLLDGNAPPTFQETGLPGTGPVVTPWADYATTIGDIVLARRDFGTSYHLSVVLDDAAQGVTHVVRGVDLFDATRIHVLLQRLLGLPTPTYHHHALMRDGQGKRLAKRDDARSIASYRAAGWTPEALRDHLTRSLVAPD
ncbi:tRNA glutamyl-Q(34) synthetase GluQRS [Jannaschia sp. 2305UL9-9]|uniref:tRNA glutamyl-Q(34) synthetase GluQRS n=1 Tax=Jannaschia sp. 2305UL9-9 TaxID=3121638 RepID=UPI00352702DA